MKKKLKESCNWFKNYIKYYCKETTFHGFRYIGSDTGNFIERIIWLVICFIGFTVTVIMSASALARLKSMPTMTSMESIFYPLGNVPFPGVTICNNNKLYLPGARWLIDSFKSYGVNETDMMKFLKELDSLLNYETVEDEENVAKYTAFLLKMGYDSDKLMRTVSQPCDKLLRRCNWLGREYNCSLAFQMIKSPRGYCCAFNWHADDVDGEEIEPTEENPFTEFLFAQTAGSPKHGLSVELNLQRRQFEFYRNEIFGAEVLFHDGTDYPEFSVQEAFIEPRHQTTVRIEGSVIESTENIRSLSPNVRQCYFDDEVELASSSDYSFQTCMTEQRIKTVMKNCKCVPFFYPNIFNGRLCNLLDVPCLQNLEQNRAHAGKKNSEMSACWPQCSDKFYHLSVISTEFKTRKSNKSTLNVFFREMFCTKYRKESLMTWDGILSLLGGIFGLCLGGSILSLFELLYFFTYHLWLYWKKEKTNGNPNGTRNLPKRIIKPVLAPLTISKPVLPELFENEYKNILRKTPDLNASRGQLFFERYYP